MKEAELKKGDILLYSCKEMPHFVPKDPSQSFKKFLEANFFVLIDRLIIWSQNNSKTTHAALAYEIKTDTDGVDKCEIATARSRRSRCARAAFVPGITKRRDPVRIGFGF